MSKLVYINVLKHECAIEVFFFIYENKIQGFTSIYNDQMKIYIHA